MAIVSRSPILHIIIQDCVEEMVVGTKSIACGFLLKEEIFFKIFQQAMRSAVQLRHQAKNGQNTAGKYQKISVIHFSSTPIENADDCKNIKHMSKVDFITEAPKGVDPALSKKYA